MKLKNCVIFVIFFLGSLGFFLVPKKIFAIDALCIECQRYNSGNPANCLSVCWPTCQSTDWIATDMSNCSSLPKTEICCTSSGGCNSSCGYISQWSWCHVAGCQKKADINEPGACYYRYAYSYTSCGATDTCEPGLTGLRAGLCSDGGCSVGGLYKTCCYNGSVEYCNGGQFSGTCPHDTVMCGYGSYPPCGPAACASGVVVPTLPPWVPTPTPLPAAGCGGDCNWWQNQFNGCGWCTDQGTCMNSGMCNKSWHKDMNTAPPGEPPNGYCSWQPGWPDQGRCCGCQGNPPACVPNCSCANNTCIGQTCSNGCGGTCAGLKCCVSNPTQPSCISYLSPYGNNTVYDDHITLTWNPPSSWGEGCPNSYSYNINFGGSNPPPSYRIGIPANPRSLEVTGLTDGVYYWQVQAVNNLQKSSWSGICSFTVKSTFDPWWQTKDGDVHGQEGLTSIIPETVAADKRYLSLAGEGGSPGVVSSRDLGRLNLGSGGISSQNWQAKIGLKTTSFSYDYLYNRLKIAAQKTIGNLIEFENSQSGTRIFVIDKDATFSTSREIASGEKVIIFVSGRATINNNLTVLPGGFLAIISKGGIVFGSSVTKAQGMFLTDGDLEVQSGSSQFVGEGSFIAAGNIDLNRDLGKKGANRDTPAELFVSRPDLYLSAPKEFLITPFIFQEVAP